MDFDGARVFVPNPPWSWPSLWQTAVHQIELWERAGATIERVWPQQGLPEAARARAAHDRLWIFPYASVGAACLQILSSLRERERERRSPPAWIWLNGEGAKQAGHLRGTPDALRAGDTLFTACASEAELVRKAVPRTVHVRVSPIPVRDDFRPVSRPERARLRARLGIRPDEKIVLYAGRLSWQKNLHLLIDAFAAVHRLMDGPTRLVVLGGVDEVGWPHLGRAIPRPYSRELGERIARHEIGDRVSFEGPRDQAGLRDWLRACDVHASLTTHYGEDFGYSIAQGLACGAPTVVTAWGGGRDFIRKGAALGVPVRVRNGLPEPSLAAAVRQVLAALDPATATRLATAAKRYAARELHADAWLAGVNASCRRVLRPAPFRAAPPARVFTSTRDPAYLRVLRAYSRA